VSDPHDFLALMRRYVEDYSNRADLAVCDEIMEPDYTVTIHGRTLQRDATYKQAAARVFDRFRDLRLTVHEAAVRADGAQFAMRFSEHGTDADGRVASWFGIGIYEWNGRRLTTSHVEQDLASRERQLSTGRHDLITPPQADPWLAATIAPVSEATETIARAWAERSWPTGAPDVCMSAGRVAALHHPSGLAAWCVVVDDVVEVVHVVPATR
jgi:hypothetical protein